MSQISPPIRILLVCAVAFLAAWMLFLRPKDAAGPPAAATPTTAQQRPVDAGGQTAGSLPGKAVERANNAAAAQEANSAKVAGATGDETASAGATATAATGGSESATGGTPAKLTDEVAKDGGLPVRVLHALADRKVVVLLFWSPKAAEDKAVRKALTGIDRHHNKVLAHATHVKRISNYTQITRGADVEQSPTVVVVDRNRKVETLVGFVDRATIDQAVTDALRSS
jgi:hypothetical protein